MGTPREEAREEAERVVSNQVRVCDERSKRIDKAVESMDGVTASMNEFIAESKEHRKSTDARMLAYAKTLYGDGTHENRGLCGDCIVLTEKVGGHQKLVNRGIAAMVGIFVTGAGGWVTSIWQLMKGGSAPQ